MSNRALQVLEFAGVLEYVAGFASSDAGRQAVFTLEPSADPETVQARLTTVDEAGRFLAAREAWTLPGFPDARQAIRRLGVEGSVLSPQELHAVGGVFAAGRALLGSLNEAAAELRTLAALASRLLAAREIETAVVRTVDAEGAVLDGASSELKRIRTRLSGAHNRVVAHLERFLDGLDGRYRVPGASVTIREGRYVIPVRREGKRSVGGYVHDESASGATVFVEPSSAIELMNGVRELERAEAREVQRILRKLTDSCRPLSAQLARSLAALTEMDRRVALARVAERWNGSVPEVGGGPLRIRGGRHPLLVASGIDAVPFDLDLDPDERVVLVTGPNTGGKTVFLKAVGLIASLAQSGVIPPVAPGTRLPVFRGIFADVGDEQSISDSLSTFSAHLRNLQEILRDADATSLVLVDEPGTGTDPKEGEALARALIETLAERRCTAVVTSHLGGLKRLAAPDNRIVNASLHFDGERLAPTYRFSKGRPGRSYGLAIARGLGFPQDVLDRAERYRDRADARLDDLLESLEEKERRVARVLAELDGERKRLTTLDAKLGEREEDLRRVERERTARARTDARRLLLDARREVESVITVLRKRASAGDSLRELSRAARRTVEEAARALQEPPAAASVPPADEVVLTEGARVRIGAAGALGEIVAVEAERVVVNVGGVRMRVAPGRLVPAGAAPGERDVRSDARTSGSVAGGTWIAPDIEPVTELDLRGLRVDEAELSLARALDAAAVADIGELRVIHGKGTGALRARVALVLERDPRVEAFESARPAEGGYGVTVARMR